MKDIKLYGFAFWCAQFTMQCNVFAEQANEFLVMNPELLNSSETFDVSKKYFGNSGIQVAAGTCTVWTNDGTAWYNHYDYSANDCISQMISSLPFYDPQTDHQFEAHRVFSNNYNTYELSLNWLQDCRAMNYFNVMHWFDEVFDDFDAIVREKNGTADLYREELHELSIFMNDFQTAFDDAVSGQFSGESYTAIHFAELVRVAIRETIFQLFHKHLFMYVDWDNIYIVGSHLNDFNPFLITFVKVLKAYSKATMKLSLSQEEYSKHYGRKEK